MPDFPGGSVVLDPPVEPITGEGLASLFEPLSLFGAEIGSPVTAEPVAGSAQGYYDPRTLRIVVDVVSPEFSANAQVATEIHELAHALVRWDCLEEDPKLTYAEEEVVAECVAYTVCGAVGLDTAGFSVPYLTSWSEGGEIERYAELIDRLAGRLEDAALGASTGSGTD